LVRVGIGKKKMIFVSSWRWKVTPSTAPIFEVRLNQKNLQNLPRRNTRKGTGTKGRPVSWVWIFSLRKKVKKSFKVLSTGLQYLVCGCTMINFFSQRKENSPFKECHTHTHVLCLCLSLGCIAVSAGVSPNRLSHPQCSLYTENRRG
jgi:hypothetical protein